MASLIPGFEYDIFISYRQKDNKYDGWVTDFVDNLKRELEATFKEDISVYFDINPHDGLLETHDVDASLKEKIKCLVFVPVISRTYCDPRSFAWEHEFKAFVGRAAQDQFGLKVRLPNGNVANRVLPIRIHDLDHEDIKLCESVLGGVLRGVEFIYKEPGVNRSLTPGDDEKRNLNNTRYRNQINKVALAIKELILGLKAGSEPPSTEIVLQKSARGECRQDKTQEIHKFPSVKKWVKVLPGALIAAVLIIAGIILFPGIFKRIKLDNLAASDGRISLAVMPFQNITNDTTWNIWQDGIQANLITSLSNTEELIVRQSETINGLLQSKGLTNYASLTPSVAGAISQKLDANVFIYGNISQAGSTIRVNAQLIDSKTKDALKSFQIDGTYEKILQIIDSLSVMIRNSLLISKLEKVGSVTLHDLHTGSTNSPEAYRCFLQGQIAYYENDFPSAIDWYKRALAIDSNLFRILGRISLAYYNNGNLEQGKAWCLRQYRNLDKMTTNDRIWAKFIYAIFFQTPNECIKCMDQLKDIDDQNPMTYFNTGDCYLQMFQYEKAITEFEKAFEIFDKWDINPNWISYYCELGIAYHKAGQYKKEKKLYKKADQHFPDDPRLFDQWAYLSLTEGDTGLANRYIKKVASYYKEQSWSDAQIASYLAYIYDMAGIPDKVEEYLRQALSLEPENPSRMRGLANFLIDRDRNIDEGLDLVEKALKLQPDGHNLLHNKGWGLYKLGKYQEALDLLKKSWDLRMKNAIYDHTAYLHLEEAKKAVAKQK